ncbi:hypothetical protein [Sinomonas sp.]|uniref:hypothetical protein n=1 Tax=Sinomonas sp. TaxID=1914986 RepID=UPI003F80F6DE
MIGTYVPPNPYIWSANDPLGNPLTISVAWRASTRALQNTTVTRDPACSLGHIYIGLGPDGTPDTSPNAYAVPTGSTTINANALKANGLSTIDDVLALQITAGP